METKQKELIKEGLDQARETYNQTIKHAKSNTNFSKIPNKINTNLLKNTKQRIVDKALQAMKNYYNKKDYNKPSHTKTSYYPLRSNYQEGYRIQKREDKLKASISIKPYHHVEATLKGREKDKKTIRKALESEKHKIGTSELLLNHNNQPELHITITTKQQTTQPKNSRTIIGVDINEDNLALTAIQENKTYSTVIEYPEIKKKRHEYFTIRKRLKKAGKKSILDKQSGKEQNYVKDKTHKLSRKVVRWCQQFEKPCITFENLKGMHENLNYGTKLNKRLNSLPFNKIQNYIKYKANQKGIPTIKINPEHTSQKCPHCNHTSQNNRTKKRFKCTECKYQDHADRNASVNIALRGVEKAGVSWNVPSLNKLPVVRTVKLRQKASGLVDSPPSTQRRRNQTNDSLGVP